MDNRRNYYRILHVQPDAPTEIIRMSYLTLMQRLKKHPDLGGDHAQAVLINEAFSTLVDPNRRAVYDMTLERERALPGYRKDPAHREAAARTTSPVVEMSDPFACAFCGTSFPPENRTRKDAVCGFCGSALCAASRYAQEDAARRAIERVPRRLALTFYLSWPQHPGFSAMTEDVSIHGMRFLTDLNLVPRERLKIECDLCSAVAMVRHARESSGQTGQWEVGVEFVTLLIKPASGILVSTHA
jgi:curved DNA-binding protein CbpA